jgi:hypothetical protein
MSLVPAYISLEDSPLPHLTFHFVPETLTITKANRWPATQRAQGAPITTPLFQGSNPTPTHPCLVRVRAPTIRCARQRSSSTGARP